MESEDIQKLRDENKSLKDSLSQLLPDKAKLDSMIADVERVMGKDGQKLDQIKKQFEAFPAQLSGLQKFLSSPEAAKALAAYQKRTK